MKVLVTGGAGLAGTAIADDLVSHGYEVVRADRSAPPDAPDTRGKAGESAFKFVDTTDIGQVTSAMRGCDAVIHMAAITNPNIASEFEVFRVNMLSNWAVLESAEIHGVRKIVMASSVNAIGAVYSMDITSRPYFPIDEEQSTLAEDAYSQSKWLGEEMAEAFVRRRPGGVQIASMRFHALLTRERQAEMRSRVGEGMIDEKAPKHFWGWTDLEEAATACRLAIEKDWDGHEAFFINAPDTSANVPTIDLVREAYPDAEIRGDLEGYNSALSIEKARRVLGWNPRVAWREA
ncbi:MAG: NAD(P)-dependent oxidoreductase [Dehalococcoidia bacterium]|jgi:UDP-glucose 4-epimerase|nr:NAD(P)-dependent oxidoreductase [Dehalococcoidia bacterium]